MSLVRTPTTTTTAAAARRPARGGRGPSWEVLSFCFFLVLVLGGASAPAFGYVRARTDDTFVPLFWFDPRQTLELAIPPDGVGISIDDFRTAAQSAISNWSTSAIACTDVNLRLAREPTSSQIVARDHRNRIVMRTGAWCRDPIALTHCNDRDPAAVALTTLFSRSDPGFFDDGQILEADIEVNAASEFRWGLIPDGPISGRDFANIYDLTSVLTHETGHFIGLAHTCRVPQDLLLTDENSDLSPLCTGIPAEQEALIADATMYPYMSPADVSLRSLTVDDARAACDLYPRFSAPVNEWVGAGGCSLGPTSAGPRAFRTGWSAILMMIVMLPLSLFVLRGRYRHSARIRRNSARTPRNP